MPEFWRAKVGEGLVLFEVNDEGSWRTFGDELHVTLGYTGLTVVPWRRGKTPWW